MKSENNMRSREHVMPRKGNKLPKKASFEAGGKGAVDKMAFDNKTAPKGKSHSVGKSKAPAMGLHGLHAAGKTVPLFNAHRVDAMESKSPPNKTRTK